MTRRLALLATLITASFVSAHALNCDDIPDSVTCDRCTGDRAGHGCINGGTCNPPDHQEICACPRDFSGSGCSNAVTRCSGGFFCDNDGTCKIPGPGCVCPAEYSGIRCDVANVVEQCTLTDGFCLHGGVCFGSDENKPCNCRYNQGGKNCEVLNVERCDDDGDVYCQNDGVCNSANTACTCAFGFMGLTCGEVNYAQINSRGGGGGRTESR